jgi:toxin ParE1/3/4
MAVKWLKTALEHMRSITDYIAQDNPDRAVIFVREIRQKTNALADFPSVGRVGRVFGTRELVAHKNYVVVYRMKALNVEIVRVRHTRQKHPQKIE